MNYEGYIDCYGMVTVNGVPKLPHADSSENGLLFTAVAIQSQSLHTYFPFYDPNFEALFNACFIGGILYRSPEPYPKPDSHDNYEGVVLGSLIENNSRSPRKLLWSLISHFGMIRGEFIARFPQVWLLLLASSFPLIKYLFLPALYILYLLQTPNISDAGATHLQFNLVSCIDYLYPRMNFLNKWFTKLKKYGTMYQVMSKYYGENHPTALIWKDSKVC